MNGIGNMRHGISDDEDDDLCSYDDNECAGETHRRHKSHSSNRDHNVDDPYDYCYHDLSVDLSDRVVDISNLVPPHERATDVVKQRSIDLLAKRRASVSRPRRSSNPRDELLAASTCNDERLYPQTVSVERIPDLEADIIFLKGKMNVSQYRGEERYLEGRQPLVERNNERFFRNDSDRQLQREGSFDRRGINRQDSSRSQTDASTSTGTTPSTEKKPAARQDSLRNVQREHSFRRQGSRRNLLAKERSFRGSLGNDGYFQQRLDKNGSETADNMRPNTMGHSNNMAEQQRFQHQRGCYYDEMQTPQRSRSPAIPNYGRKGFYDDEQRMSQRQRSPAPSRARNGGGGGGRGYYDDDDDDMRRPQQQQQRRPQRSPAPPPPNDRKNLEIEISPGVFAQLRGAGETWIAVEDGNIEYPDCMCCGMHLMCIADADYVLCPDCKVVSPIAMDSSRRGGPGGGGVGLGLRADDYNGRGNVRPQYSQPRQYDAPTRQMQTQPDPNYGRGRYPDQRQHNDGYGNSRGRHY